MDWKLLNSRPIFEIGLEMSKWEPFSEISHVTVCDINFSCNTTQKGIDLLDDPQNHFLNWGRKLDGTTND